MLEGPVLFQEKVDLSVAQHIWGYLTVQSHELITSHETINPADKSLHTRRGDQGDVVIAAALAAKSVHHRP